MKNQLQGFNVHKIRKDFPMLSKKMHNKPLVYLDSAATAQKPLCVIEAINHFYSNDYGTVHRAVYEFAGRSTELFQSIRSKVRKFLNAEKDEEIIFTRGTTESINLVATSFSKAYLREGDEVLISAMEHHANIVPWQMACREHGAALKVIPMNEKGELLLEEYAKLLNPKTKLVAFNHISNILGTVNPVKQMIEMAHANGSKVLLDGAQSAPHMAIDVQELDIDFFVFSGHKLFGPTGIGVLYGKSEWLNEMPPYQGGGDMIQTVTFEETIYNTLPLKFEAGTPMIAEVIGLGAAIDYVNAVGISAIQQWEKELFDYASEKIKEVPGYIPVGQAKHKQAILTFVIEDVHALDLGTMLDFMGIAIRTGHHCAQPTLKFFNLCSTARASFAFYNTKEEIDYFVESLVKARQKLI